MKFSQIILISLLLFFEVSYSQSIPNQDAKQILLENRETPIFEINKEKAAQMELLKDFYPSTLIKKDYDVLNYNIFLDWTSILSGPDDMVETREWNGVIDITLQLSKAINIIEFDAVTLKINKVTYKGNELDFTKLDTKLNVVLPPNVFNKGDKLTLKIEYTYIGLNNGIYIFPKNYTQNNGQTVVAEKIVYSQNEPSLARNWFPCNDQPDDKAMTAVTIKVPEGFTPASNGTLNKIEKDSSGVSFYFSSQYPMTTYLICANASKFLNYQAIYKSKERDIPLNYYIWDCDKDSASPYGHNAKKAFQYDTIMMRICENKFGPYPWESYGIVAVEPYMFGGMEHQTLTTVHRNWLYGYYVAGFMHELVHQWLGDLITTATWNDIWINEGGASWGEGFLWSNYYGEAGYNSNMQSAKATYINRGHYTTPIYYIPKDEWVGQYYELAYLKGAWIYNQLYQWYGGENFLTLLRGIMEQYKYKSLETKEFAAALKSANTPFPVPIDSLFSQYVIQAGHPIFNLSGEVSRADNEMYNLKIHLEQVQTGANIPEVFWTPQRLILKSNERIDTLFFVNKTRTLDTNFVINFAPTKAYLDENYVLMQTDTAELIFNDVKQVDKDFDVKIFPNPASSDKNINIRINSTNNIDLRIILYDLLGNKAIEVYEGKSYGSQNYNIDTQKLNPGLYFVHISYENKNIIKKINIVK